MNGIYVMLFVALAGVLAAYLWAQVLMPESKRKILEIKLQRNLNISILTIFAFQFSGIMPQEIPLSSIYIVLAMIVIPTIFNLVTSFSSPEVRNSFAIYKKIILIVILVLTLTAIFVYI